MPSQTAPKLFVAICAAWLVASLPSQASDQEDRFIEFSNDESSRTYYDLNTVQMIVPGRFTIMYTKIYNPDVMKFKLRVHANLLTYCSRPDGKYDAPAELFELGKPDLPIGKIEVKSDGTTYRHVNWELPYKRLALAPISDGRFWQFWINIKCIYGTKQNADKWNLDGRSHILNGSQGKELYDCKRGLFGFFGIGNSDNDDPAKAMTVVVNQKMRVWLNYMLICYRVMGELPYEPE